MRALARPRGAPTDSISAEPIQTANDAADQGFRRQRPSKITPRPTLTEVRRRGKKETDARLALEGPLERFAHPSPRSKKIKAVDIPRQISISIGPNARPSGHVRS